MFHSARGIRVKLGTKHVSKRLRVLHRQGISMLTGLTVFSLTCKYVFDGPEFNAKSDPHGIEFCKPWNETDQWIEFKEYTRKIVSFV